MDPKPKATALAEFNKRLKPHYCMKVIVVENALARGGPRFAVGGRQRALHHGAEPKRAALVLRTRRRQDRPLRSRARRVRRVPAGLFNVSLDGNVRRAIDLHEGDKVDEKALIRAAVALNAAKAPTRRG